MKSIQIANRRAEKRRRKREKWQNSFAFSSRKPKSQNFLLLKNYDSLSYFSLPPSYFPSVWKFFLFVWRSTDEWNFSIFQFFFTECNFSLSKSAKNCKTCCNSIFFLQISSNFSNKFCYWNFFFLQNFVFLSIIFCSFQIFNYKCLNFLLPANQKPQRFVSQMKFVHLFFFISIFSIPCVFSVNCYDCSNEVSQK